MYYKKTPSGIVIRIQAKPNARKDSIRIKKKGIKVATTAPPVRGNANRQILRIISNHFGCQAELKKGSANREKEILLKNMSETEFKNYF